MIECITPDCVNPHVSYYGDGEAEKRWNLRALSREEQVRADVLSDPMAVHVNMLRGGIAKPSPVNIWHLYGDRALVDAMPSSVTERLVKAHVEAERASVVVWLRDFGAGLAEARSGTHDLQYVNAAGDMIKLLADSIEIDAHHTHAPPGSGSGQGERDG